MNLKTRSLEQSKKGVVTVSVVPPPIVAYFNAKLLSYPMPGMKEPQYYRDLYQERIKRKYKPGSRKYREYEEVMAVYEELYEWKKAAEAHGKTEIKKATKGPAIPVEAINRLRGGLGHSLRASFKLDKRRKVA